MIVTYLRSSSYNQWDFCQQSYFLKYVLGLPDKSNKAADMGNVCHKALELLAAKKLAMQNGETTFGCDELGQKWPVNGFTAEMAARAGYNHYSNKSPHHDWSEADYNTALDWTYKTMDYQGGLYNPLKREIIWPEKYFDITFEEPWAEYTYEFQGELITGHLSIKGTMDLICWFDEEKTTAEMLDWKTGKRKDWATGKEKDYDYLCQDSQLCMYFLAMCEALPDVEHFVVTIMFINHGGPFPLPFCRDDLPWIKDRIRQRFQTIKASLKPRLIYPNWKCERLCEFGKNGQCLQIRDEIEQLGIDRVTEMYANKSSFQNYGEGGGRSNVTA